MSPWLAATLGFLAGCGFATVLAVHTMRGVLRRL